MGLNSYNKKGKKLAGSNKRDRKGLSSLNKKRKKR